VRSKLAELEAGGRSAASVVVVAALVPSALVVACVASAVACEDPPTPEEVRLAASLRMGAAPMVTVAVGAGVFAIPGKK